MFIIALIILLALTIAAVGGGSRGRDSRLDISAVSFCSAPSAPSLS